MHGPIQVRAVLMVFCFSSLGKAAKLQATFSEDYNLPLSAVTGNPTFLNQVSASLRGMLINPQVPADDRLPQEIIDDGERVSAEVRAHSQQRRLLQSENQDMQLQVLKESLAAETSNAIAAHKEVVSQVESARSKLRREKHIQSQLEMMLEESKQKEASALELVEHRRSDEEHAETDVVSRRTEERKSRQDYQAAYEEAKALSKHLHELNNDAAESEKQAKKLSIEETKLFESVVQKMNQLHRLHPIEFNQTDALTKISRKGITPIMTSTTVKDMNSVTTSINGTSSANLRSNAARNVTTAGKQQVGSNVSLHTLISIPEHKEVALGT